MGKESYFYRIDSHDRIIFVSENWNDFAIDNDAPEECKHPSILDKSHRKKKDD